MNYDQHVPLCIMYNNYTYMWTMHVTICNSILATSEICHVPTDYGLVTHIQSSTVIMWSNIVRYCINECMKSDRISFKYWIHKRHTIPCAKWWAMGCLLTIFFRKLTAAYWHCTVYVSGLGNHGLTLRWRHNGLDNVSNHQPHDCLLNLSFGRRSK